MALPRRETEGVSVNSIRSNGELHRCDCSECKSNARGKTARDHRKINRILCGIDERKKRMIAGYLAQERGHGGIQWIADITGLSRATISRGQTELDARGAYAVRRVRRRGGGRKRLEKKAFVS